MSGPQVGFLSARAVGRVAAALFVVAFSAATSQAYFADVLTDSQFTSSFGSGLVTGAQDSGGRWLGDTVDPPANPGYITVQFLTPAGDGVGADFVIYDVASSANETANVFASTDGLAFTLLQGITAVANTVDINGVFPGPVNYLKIVNTSTTNSIDIDAVQANYAFIPEPAAGGLALIALAGLRGLRRRA